MIIVKKSKNANSMCDSCNCKNVCNAYKTVSENYAVVSCSRDITAVECVPCRRCKHRATKGKMHYCNLNKCNFELKITKKEKTK